MAKRKRKLPHEVQSELLKGWRVVCGNKEIVVIALKNKRKLWDVSSCKFVCEWKSDPKTVIEIEKKIFKDKEVATEVATEVGAEVS
ncbi:hypothetical protein CVU82_00400 [Candidatus Falkowbacteria bacterium HGW-Falkowbacteria-1]|jgi:hypothetical protein|uniref:Uncharacterized protein n=1 Tax=Candidatus Falkowbacteria bacterium HGW-Falkowbacteria-1 TaxID=2013768 RepID=A0A2N2EAD8_9BACT|nr:MAG: hypothetical protein CVU82_00400 [Candidatus Falkowbacteria bacterium HGW-Falkowbacteria-1]